MKIICPKCGADCTLQEGKKEFFCAVCGTGYTLFERDGRWLVKVASNPAPQPPAAQSRWGAVAFYALFPFSLLYALLERVFSRPAASLGERLARYGLLALIAVILIAAGLLLGLLLGPKLPL